MNVRHSSSQLLPASDLMLSQLSELSKQLETLLFRIQKEVERLLRSSEIGAQELTQECAFITKEFQRFSRIALQIKEPAEHKCAEMRAKPNLRFVEPIQARRFETVMMLHLVSEQGMNKRQEELKAREEKKKQSLELYERTLVLLQEKFDETVERLNLLLYMCEWVQEEGVIPQTIMYMTIPENIKAPVVSIRSKTDQQSSREMGEKEKQMRDLEKKRELLLQMRKEMKETKQ
jgi:hypothetical protein